MCCEQSEYKILGALEYSVLGNIISKSYPPLATGRPGICRLRRRSDVVGPACRKLRSTRAASTLAYTEVPSLP